MARLLLLNCAVPTLIGALMLTVVEDVSAAGVVAVVSAASPLVTLSKDQAIDIFLGKASRFPDGSVAVPIDQVEGSVARDEFYLRFAGKSPAQLKAHWSKIIFTGRGQPPAEAVDGDAVKRELLEDPNAIGYIDQSLVDDSLKMIILQ